MKRGIKRVLGAGAVLLLCATFGMTAFSASDRDAPTLFYNDEVWYKDEIAPALLRNGVVHVPGEFIAMLDSISLTTENDGDNFLFTNTETGDYVSILYSAGAACVNGRIVEGASLFRENGCCYLDVEFMCENLGLTTEYSDETAGASRSVRVSDGDNVMTFEELLAAYDSAEETSPPETTPEEDDDAPDYSPTLIYLICRDTQDAQTVLARSLAERRGFSYSCFLTPETEDFSSLGKAREIGLSVASLEEAEALNDRLQEAFLQKTHLVLTTGDDEEDRRLEEAGYFVLTPDFTVRRTTDARVTFGEIIQFAATREVATVLLGDVWQSETLLAYLDELDKGYYRIGKINGVY